MPKVTLGTRGNPLLEFPLEGSILSSSRLPTSDSKSHEVGKWEHAFEGDGTSLFVHLRQRKERDLAAASALGIAAAICAVLLWLWL